MLKKGESTENPKLIPFMKPAVEDAMKKQLDKKFGEDAGNHPDAERTRQPTIVKTSSAEFYEKVAQAMCRKSIKKKLREGFISHKER